MTNLIRFEQPQSSNKPQRARECAKKKRKREQKFGIFKSFFFFLFTFVSFCGSPSLPLPLSLTLPVDFFPAIVFRRRHEANNRGLERARASERFEKRVLFDPRVESRAMCPPHHHNHLRTPLTIASWGCAFLSLLSNPTGPTFAPHTKTQTHTYTHIVAATKIETKPDSPISLELSLFARAFWIWHTHTGTQIHRYVPRNRFVMTKGRLFTFFFCPLKREFSQPRCVCLLACPGPSINSPLYSTTYTQSPSRRCKERKNKLVKILIAIASNFGGPSLDQFGATRSSKNRLTTVRSGFLADDRVQVTRGWCRDFGRLVSGSVGREMSRPREPLIYIIDLYLSSSILLLDVDFPWCGSLGSDSARRFRWVFFGESVLKGGGRGGGDTNVCHKYHIHQTFWVSELLTSSHCLKYNFPIGQ